MQTTGRKGQEPWRRRLHDVSFMGTLLGLVLLVFGLYLRSIRGTTTLILVAAPIILVCLVGVIYTVRSKWYKPTRNEIRRDWELYLFLLIPLAYLIIFKYIPMFGVQIAFRKYRIKDGIWNSQWVGMKQFNKFFTSPQFKQIVPNTIILSLYSLLAGFPLPIILALFLNVMRNQKYKKVVQMVTYIPHFISTVVLVAMIISICNPRIGLYGILMKAITGSEPSDPMGKAYLFRHLYVWSGVWQNMGWSSIIYLAALSAVDMELHEAAQIDGASRFRRVLHIDLPTVLPTAIILLIMSAGSIMSVGFEKVYLMQNSLNKSTSEIISTYVYYIGLVSGTGDFSYSTAIDLFNSVINLIMLLTVNTISSKLGETSLF